MLGSECSGASELKETGLEGQVDVERQKEQEACEDYAKRDYAKRVVFAVDVVWGRSLVGSQTLEEEYWTAKSGLPGGSGLYVGRMEVFGGLSVFEAVVVLRGRLMKIGELAECFRLGERDTWARIKEPDVGLGDWLKGIQKPLSSLGRTIGELVVVERGDEETLAMLDGVPEWERYEMEVSELLTGRMRGYQRDVSG